MGLDSRLKWLLDERSTSGTMFHEVIELVSGPGANESAWRGPQPVDVLVRAVPNADRDAFKSALSQVGYELHSLGGTRGAYTATGTISVDDLTRLDAIAIVAQVEAPREIQPELLVSLIDSRAIAAHALTPPARGGNALVGVIDSGIDLAHAVFKTPTGTRIRCVSTPSSTARSPG